MKHDIAIIGSGLGSLISGCLLSKEGYNVCIIEKNKSIGGCLQSFKRDNCIFDTGIHYIGSLDKGQIMHKIFSHLGIYDSLNLRKLDEDAFDIIKIRDQEFYFAQGYDNFVDVLSKAFPEHRGEITNYINEIRKIKETYNVLLFEENDSYFTHPVFNRYLDKSAFDFIAQATDNPLLRNVLAGLNPLYAGDPNKTPLYIHALINAFFIDSAWRFNDGTTQIATALADQITKNGGTILTGNAAKKFHFTDNVITAVELENNELIEAKNFISGIHPNITLDMLPEDKLRKSYRKRILGLENSTSVFAVYMVMKKNSFKYFNSNFYYYNFHNTWYSSYYNKETWPQSYMMYPSASSNQSKYTDSLTVMSFMHYNEVEKWNDSITGKRNQEYYNFKEKKAEQLINLVEKSFPGIKNSISKVYTASPLTYRDYTGSVNGSIYGIQKDYKNPVKSVILPRTKIPNLFLTGQNINIHGAIGVSIGALLTSAEFTGLKYLINKLNNVKASEKNI